MDQVDRNYVSFAAQLSELLPAHRGEFALLRDQAVVRFYDNGFTAYEAGINRFGEGGFSVQDSV